jgi:hypothetical protein
VIVFLKKARLFVRIRSVGVLLCLYLTKPPTLLDSRLQPNLKCRIALCFEIYRDPNDYFGAAMRRREFITFLGGVGVELLVSIPPRADQVIE